jgi:quinol monooxygenase YgiN
LIGKANPGGTPVKVILHLMARPDTVDRLKAVLLRIAQHSRAEEGCNSYQVLQDLADPCNFTLVEDWGSPAALAHHMTLPHTQKGVCRGRAAARARTRYA